MNIDQRELFLYITNHREIYFGLSIPTCNSLAKKKVTGKYQKSLAVKAFLNVVKNGIARYRKEEGMIGPFSQKEKEEIAAKLLEYYSDHIDETVKALKKAAKKTKKTSKKK